jgi:hypothetical protein
LFGDAGFLAWQGYELTCTDGMYVSVLTAEAQTGVFSADDVIDYLNITVGRACDERLCGSWWRLSRWM